MVAGSDSTSGTGTSQGGPAEDSGGHPSNKRHAVRNDNNREDASRRDAKTAAQSSTQRPGGGTGGNKTSGPATLSGECGPASSVSCQDRMYTKRTAE
ncbi:hypothetical protein NDU88_006859 [Pleurodeles waltl]|uniref:Uncharacterized protein n=1 Tax=Pleurodeles waltl TaxID=8319 RepID=A0AAV7PJK0_PLEWA|nr:hypothetical protein NDU88_006859 [Pleurodeles waltl]